MKAGKGAGALIVILAFWCASCEVWYGVAGALCGGGYLWQLYKQRSQTRHERARRSGAAQERRSRHGRGPRDDVTVPTAPPKEVLTSVPRDGLEPVPAERAREGLQGRPEGSRSVPEEQEAVRNAVAAHIRAHLGYADEAQIEACPVRLGDDVYVVKGFVISRPLGGADFERAVYLFEAIVAGGPTVRKFDRDMGPASQGGRSRLYKPDPRTIWRSSPVVGSDVTLESVLYR